MNDLADVARYPRDLIGHGPNPEFQWPGNARIAIQIVVNYEEGGERCLLHGDLASEAFLSEIIGADSWDGMRHWNMESIYEYGTRAGFWRLRRILDQAGVPVTVYGVATALARSPEQTQAMIESGWELASHGLKWIEYRDFSTQEEREHMTMAIKLHEQVVGYRPTGWYTGRCSMQTVALAAEEGGFLYVADSYADDLPYWLEFNGRPQLIVPYTLDANDMRFATNQGFNTGDDFFTYLKETFDVLYAEGLEGSPRMMSVGLHCRLAGRPGRARALQRFIDHAQKHDNVWFARRDEIASYWAREYPWQPRECQPSKLGRDEFVEMFGGIFEHSPWIAEQAWELELGSQHDTPVGIHNALCRVMRSASREARAGVLNAHPDLAGKLTQARLLTRESSEEQASAGLDELTSREKSELTRLNDTYRQRHGIPFIIAVKDHDKQGIMREFGRRIDNDSETEFRTACTQVERIAWHRIRDMMT